METVGNEGLEKDTEGEDFGYLLFTPESWNAQSGKSS